AVRCCCLRDPPSSDFGQASEGGPERWKRRTRIFRGKMVRRICVARRYHVAAAETAAVRWLQTSLEWPLRSASMRECRASCSKSLSHVVAVDPGERLAA